jgi:hypothetical protein
MNHKGVQYTLIRSETPGVWKWQFRIGDLVRSGKTETRLPLLAMRRIQLKIDREACGARTWRSDRAAGCAPIRFPAPFPSVQFGRDRPSTRGY